MLSFRGLDVGETADLSLSKGMRSPASRKRDADKPLKRGVREPRNERKAAVIPALPFQSVTHKLSYAKTLCLDNTTKKLSLTYLDFPEFVVNTVVPERHSRKRWGSPEGEHEGGPPRGGQSGEGAGIPHLRIPGGSPREHRREGTMVFTCQRHKSLQSQYVANIPRGKLRKLLSHIP